MVDIVLNPLAIFAAALSGMALGAVWYSPLLFGSRWMECIGKTPQTLGSQKAPMIGSMIASLMTALGLAVIFSLAGVANLSSGIGIGLVLGLLIVFPALLSDNLFCGWGTPLLLIQSGYRVFSIVLMAIALVYVG